jgi:DNA-binding MarR family transcriptional regulator
LAKWSLSHCIGIDDVIAARVVSEIVDQLEKNSLLSRMADEADRRRTLVWLTDAGRERLVADQDVLSRAALEEA